MPGMENNTSALACQQTPVSDIGEKAGRSVGLALPMCVALVSNLLVIVVFKRSPATRTNTNCFIVNMAVSDLLCPFFCLPWYMMQIWLGRGRFLIGGPLGEFLCKLVAFVIDLSTGISIQSLVLIAVERFIAVVYPLQKVNFTSRIRTTLLIVTWVVAAVLHSPYWLVFRLKTVCSGYYCMRDWTALSHSAWKMYYTPFRVSILVPFPLLVIAGLYAAILLKLRRGKIPGDQGFQSDARCARRRERNVKITKMSICIILAFAICYLPIYVYVMISHFSPTPPNYYFVLVAYNLVWTNSAINPCILFYFCGNFRQGLRNLFGCLCCRQSSNPVVVEQNIELQEMGRNARV